MKHLNSLAAVIDVEMSLVITNSSGEKQREEVLLKSCKSGLVLIDGKVPLGETLLEHLHPVSIPALPGKL